MCNFELPFSLFWANREPAKAVIYWWTLLAAELQYKLLSKSVLLAWK
ncbi:hypothetical protein SOVF_098620 [Spinacia oleracea]|nr:hypothetical protein SOVF_098620 [Spinacia oleracea]